MPLFQVYHEYDNDDTIGYCLNALQKLLEYHYRSNDELAETKSILDYAFDDYDSMIQKLKDTNQLLENAKQALEERNISNR